MQTFDIASLISQAPPQSFLNQAKPPFTMQVMSKQLQEFFEACGREEEVPNQSTSFNSSSDNGHTDEDESPNGTPGLRQLHRDQDNGLYGFGKCNGKYLFTL